MIEQKGMTKKHDFCYSFSFSSSPFFRREKKGKNITSLDFRSCLSARSFIIFWVNNYKVIKKRLKTSLAASFSFHSSLIFLGWIRKKGERITSMYCKIIHSYTTGNKETCIIYKEPVQSCTCVNHDKNLYNLLDTTYVYN